MGRRAVFLAPIRRLIERRRARVVAARQRWLDRRLHASYGESEWR